MADQPRRVVVVGAGSGIGAAVAAHLHNRGDHVLAVDVRPHETPAADRALCDLRDADSIQELLCGMGDEWDMLAHVAGVPGTAPAADVLKVNYLGMRLMVEGMLPRLRAGGSVVVIASTAALGWDQRIETLDGLLQATTADAVSCDATVVTRRSVAMPVRAARSGSTPPRSSPGSASAGNSPAGTPIADSSAVSHRPSTPSSPVVEALVRSVASRPVSQ